jgi:hypothetical protein
MREMEILTIKVKNKEKLLFIYEVLKYFDFVELPEFENVNKSEQKHDFFSSAGIWQNRDISQETLRNKAWKKG